MRRLGGPLLELRRSKIDIVGKILSIAVDGIGKTAIVYRANLNFARADKYIGMLLKEGLISTLGGSKVKYKTTDKGLNFLKLHKNLREVADLSIP